MLLHIYRKRKVPSSWQKIILCLGLALPLVLSVIFQLLHTLKPYLSNNMVIYLKNSNWVFITELINLSELILSRLGLMSKIKTSKYIKRLEENVVEFL